MVLIIIGVLAGVFLLIFIANKYHFIKRIKKLRQHKSDVEQTHTMENDCATITNISIMQDVNDCDETIKKKRHRHICKKHKQSLEESETAQIEKSEDESETKSHYQKDKIKSISENRNKRKKSAKAANESNSTKITRPDIRKKTNNSKARSRKKKKTFKKQDHNTKINCIDQQYRPKCRQPKNKQSGTKHRQHRHSVKSSKFSDSVSSSGSSD